MNIWQYIWLLLYADDLVLLAEYQEDLQMPLDITQKWCNKSKLNINNTHKYLGLLMDQHLNFNDCIRTLAD